MSSREGFHKHRTINCMENGSNTYEVIEKKSAASPLLSRGRNQTKTSLSSGTLCIRGQNPWQWYLECRYRGIHFERTDVRDWQHLTRSLALGSGGSDPHLSQGTSWWPEVRGAIILILHNRVLPTYNCSRATLSWRQFFFFWGGEYNGGILAHWYGESHCWFCPTVGHHLINLPMWQWQCFALPLRAQGPP